MCISSEKNEDSKAMILLSNKKKKKTRIEEFSILEPKHRHRIIRTIVVG